MNIKHAKGTPGSLALVVISAVTFLVFVSLSFKNNIHF